MTAPVKFRFDADSHEYTALDTGEVLPHITGMLDRTGHVDDLWFTEESSERGTCVHKLTADYDQEALDVETCISAHKGYLHAYIAAMSVLRPEILEVEVPIVHPLFRFGGRPDRIVRLFGMRGVLEIKSAQPAKSHHIQTALQAVLDAGRLNITPESLGRWCLYLKPNGRYKLDDHNRESFTKTRDFAEARRVIRECCGVGARCAV
jgi:hypothetical protein